MPRRNNLKTGVFWDDLMFPASAINPPGAAADPVLNTTNGLLEFSASATNTIAIHVQMPHAWKEGSEIVPHVHWRKKTAGAGDVVWEIKYEFQNIGSTFTDSPTTDTVSTASVGGGGDALVHSLSSWDHINMDDKTISCMGLITVSRLGGDGADTYGGVAQLLQFDIHYQRDSFGSIAEYSKTNVWYPIFRTVSK